MNKDSILEKDAQFIWHPYTQMKTAAPPLPIVKGQGALVWDEDGNEYIDGVASWWTNIHGHAHPHIAKTVYEQMMELEHVIFAGFTHRPAVKLAERLIPHLPSKQAKIFFSDNGSTAVEIGMKMAMQAFHNQGKARRYLVAFEDAFHGETFGSMSASADLSFNNAFKEHLFEVKRIPTPTKGNEEKSKAALRKILAEESVYAFLFEPLIQGAGGMIMYSPEALDELIEICKAQGVFCIADEVMTGFYRTGKMFASNYLSNQPDIICMSKGITGGTLPLAVTSCTQEIYDAFLSDDKYKTFFHGHSYTGNPVGCAAGLASLDLIEKQETLDNIARIIKSHEVFSKKIEKHSRVKEVRQQGTIVAVEFKTDESTSYFNNLRDRLYDFFIENGAILRPLGNVIYILPPYCITKKQLDHLYVLIERALNEVKD